MAIKTTNYVLNCINALIARKAGGYLGIMVDSENNVLVLKHIKYQEATIANIGILLKSNELLIPPFDNTLVGTTTLRLIEYAEDVLIPKGIIKGILREKIKVDKAKEEAKEVMLLGGNACVPILKWDKKQISDKPGPLTLNIQKFFNEIDCKIQHERKQTNIIEIGRAHV